jgi:RsiW-degrading membrane proteinase PrsW (M82 family)
VALGFAAFENVLYLFNNIDSLYEVATSRALLAVPMHFCCGIVMGYYVSMAKFYPYRRSMNFALAFIVPMAIHGIYDALLMLMPVMPLLSLVLYAAVIAFSFFVWKRALRYIREHKRRDELDRGVDSGK